jgi:ribonuclease BN (tRNA processing enzyme)
MNVIFLGTNGWYDTLTGNTCSVLVQSDEYDVIFDAGNGFAKADSYITQEKPTYLFISHYHIDHIVGLHTLTKFNFENPLRICGQTGIVPVLNSVIREPFTIPFEKLPFPVLFTELAEGMHHVPFPLECRLLVHPVPCFGYSIIIDDKKISFCTDTGFCENAVLLSRNSDLLIAECGLKPGENSPGWPHLNPEDSIRIAKEARAKRLALIHFAPHKYPTIEDRFELRKQYEKEYPGIIITTDGLAIEF